MKKLGAYIGDDFAYGDDIFLKKNTFVWYEIVRNLSGTDALDIYDVSLWSLNGGYPNGRNPDARYSTRDPHYIEDTVISMKDVADKYCIEWENNGPWRIEEWLGYYDYHHDHECITVLKVDKFGGSNNSCHFKLEGERAFSILKNATVNRIRKTIKRPITAFDDIVMQKTQTPLEKYFMKSTLNSYYGMGGFTTNPASQTFTISKEDLRRMRNKIKETKTMEKKMTQTDLFLKDLNGITITSTYSKLDHDFGKPYYIYYPEMEEITEDIADTLLTVLIMAKRDFIHKVVFNPEKGTTTISKSTSNSVTVRCRDGKFDYILGYAMAKSKMYIGADDYNWFNKIKNHRKTHIEYTEKKPTKKGGKK